MPHKCWEIALWGFYGGVEVVAWRLGGIVEYLILEFCSFVFHLRVLLLCVFYA